MKKLFKWVVGAGLVALGILGCRGLSFGATGGGSGGTGSGYPTAGIVLTDNTSTNIITLIGGTGAGQYRFAGATNAFGGGSTDGSLWYSTDGVNFLFFDNAGNAVTAGKYAAGPRSGLASFFSTGPQWIQGYVGGAWTVDGGGWTAPTKSYFGIQALTVSGTLNMNLGATNGNQAAATNGGLAMLDNATYLAIQKGLMAGSTYSNWNRLGLTNVMNRYRQGKNPIVLRIGDGFTSGLVPATALEWALFNTTNYFGPRAGWISDGDSYPLLRIVSSTGTGGYSSSHGRLWFGAYGIVPAQNDTIVYGSEGGSGLAQVKANVGFVIYAKNTGCGHYEIKTNMNGGSFALTQAGASINADTGASYTSGILWFTNAVVGDFQIQVKQLDAGKALGFVAVVGLLDTTTRGPIQGEFQGPGSNPMDDIACTNIVFRNSVWSNLQPDLVLFEKVGTQDNTSGSDENTATVTYSNMTTFVDMFVTNANMQCDLVYCASPFEVDTGSPREKGNYYTRTNIMGAKARNSAQTCAGNVLYFDGRGPFGDIAMRTNRGWQSIGNLSHFPDTFWTNAFDPLLLHWLSLDVLNQK